MMCRAAGDGFNVVMCPPRFRYSSTVSFLLISPHCVCVWIRVYSHLKTLQSYYNIFWRVCQVFYCNCCHELAPSGMRKSGSGMNSAWILCGMVFACGDYLGFVCGMLDVRCQIEVKRPG